MESAVNFSENDIAKMEIRRFINEGLQDIYHNQLIDSDTVFDKLEERYNLNE